MMYRFAFKLCFQFQLAPLHNDITGWSAASLTIDTAMEYAGPEVNSLNMFVGATAYREKFMRIDGTASPLNGPPSEWKLSA
jgi:hypothetical protein